MLFVLIEFIVFYVSRTLHFAVRLSLLFQKDNVEVQCRCCIRLPPHVPSTRKVPRSALEQIVRLVNCDTSHEWKPASQFLERA
jgi:hypothetical protein